jgi:DNA-binding transcriptional LysR family regulator
MSTRDLEPTLLTTFLAVLDAGRISAAAQALHLSQPAVTAQVRRLEGALGRMLFLRSVHGVTPTAAGLRLASHARTVRKLLDDAALDVADVGTEQQALHIAASTTIAAHVLPQLLAEFRTRHGNVSLHVEIGNTSEVVTAVREGRSPLGLVEGHARAMGVRLEPFLDDELVPIVARDSSMNVRQLGDLADVPLLWREAGSGTRAVVERALQKAGVRRKRVRALDVVLGSTEAIVSGASAGLGVAFVSRMSVRMALAAGAVRIVPGLGLDLRRTFRWALPAGSLSGTAAQFHAFASRRVAG